MYKFLNKKKKKKIQQNAAATITNQDHFARL
jgi:hypothetical protein